MAGLYHSAHFAAVHRHRTEMRQQRGEEENVRRAALRQETQAALKELEELEARSEAWNRAQRLRAFIAAYEAAARSRDGGLGPDDADWIERALRHTDRIDPLTPTPVSALDYEEVDLRAVSAWQMPDEL